MKRIYLGGTINSNWREEMKPLLGSLAIEYYDPIISGLDVVRGGTDDAMRVQCEIHLHIFTPNQKEIYEHIEAILSSVVYGATPVIMFLSIDGDYEEPFLENGDKKLISYSSDKWIELTRRCEELYKKAGAAFFKNDPVNLLYYLSALVHGKYIDVTSTIPNLLSYRIGGVDFSEYYYIETI